MKQISPLTRRWDVNFWLSSAWESQIFHSYHSPPPLVHWSLSLASRMNQSRLNNIYLQVKATYPDLVLNVECGPEYFAGSLVQLHHQGGQGLLVHGGEIGEGLHRGVIVGNVCSVLVKSGHCCEAADCDQIYILRTFMYFLDKVWQKLWRMCVSLVSYWKLLELQTHFFHLTFLNLW